MLSQPFEDSLQRKEDFIKVLNGPILVTINKNNHNKKYDVYIGYISRRSAFMVNSVVYLFIQH